MLKYFEYTGCSHSFTFFFVATTSSSFFDGTAAVVVAPSSSTSISISSLGSLSNIELSTLSRIIEWRTATSGTPFFSMLKYFEYTGCSHSFTFFFVTTFFAGSADSVGAISGLEIIFSVDSGREGGGGGGTYSTNSFGLFKTDGSSPQLTMSFSTSALGILRFSILKYFLKSG